MVECLAPTHTLAGLATLLPVPAAGPWWMDALGRAELVIAAADFLFLLAVWVVLVLLWLRMDRLVAWVRHQVEAQARSLPKNEVFTPQPLADTRRNDEHDRRMELIIQQLRQNTDIAREMMDLLGKIKTTQATYLAAQTAPHPDPPSPKQPPRETRRIPFEESYNAVFADPTRDERLPGIKDQFRVNFRDKTSADRNPQASSPLVRDPSGWLTIFVEEGTETLYLAPALVFRAGTLMNTQVGKLSSLFTFHATPVTRLDRAATARRIGEEFHLDQPGSMS